MTEDTPFRLASTYGRLTQTVGGDAWGYQSNGASQQKQKSARRNEARAERLRAGKPDRSDLAVMLASYERNTTRPPITLPRISIQQQDAE